MFGFNYIPVLSYICCFVKGNAGKKMSNAKYFTAFLLWMIFALVIEYIPGGRTVDPSQFSDV